MRYKSPTVFLVGFMLLLMTMAVPAPTLALDIEVSNYGTTTNGMPYASRSPAPGA